MSDGGLIQEKIVLYLALGCRTLQKVVQCFDKWLVSETGMENHFGQAGAIRVDGFLQPSWGDLRDKDLFSDPFCKQWEKSDCKRT